MAAAGTNAPSAKCTRRHRNGNPRLALCSLARRLRCAFHFFFAFSRNLCPHRPKCSRTTHTTSPRRSGRYRVKPLEEIDADLALVRPRVRCCVRRSAPARAARCTLRTQERARALAGQCACERAGARLRAYGAARVRERARSHVRATRTHATCAAQVGRLGVRVRRVFLADGDAMTLPVNRLRCAEGLPVYFAASKLACVCV